MKPLFHHFSILTILSLFSLPLLGSEPSGEILINHHGYLPASSKVFLVKSDKPVTFSVVNSESGKTVLKGMTHLKPGSFGNYVEGDFTAVTAEGTYVIEWGKQKSGPFKISASIYEDPILKSVTYFSIQRCGASTTGYASPCHVDDGRRLDTGPGWGMAPHRDVSGGWHDAGDYRKWVAFTLYGMIGLSHVAELMGPGWHRDRIQEELKWGNQYFLAMQNDAGYVMNYCGGDDGMFLTDNKPGTPDDRPIHTEPASFVHNNFDRTAQYNFTIAEALTARIFKSSDPEYSTKCLGAAGRCLAWCENNFYANQAPELGSALLAYMEMHKTTGDSRFLEKAVTVAGRLLDLQIKDPIDAANPVRGFFKTSILDDEPDQQSWQGPQHMLGLCALYESLPGHPNAPHWKEAIRSYYDDYLIPVSAMNNFQMVPIGLYKSTDPGGNQKIAGYWLRNLPVTANNAWGGGSNANIASSGIGMIHAARILGENKLLSFAQRQLDWVIGFNPLNMSTMEGVGHNQPIRFINRTLNIPPLIEGAVMNGIGSTTDDQADMAPGSWQNCEYWTPQVSQTMWLMAELSNYGNKF